MKTILFALLLTAVTGFGAAFRLPPPPRGLTNDVAVKAAAAGHRPALRPAWYSPRFTEAMTRCKLDRCKVPRRYRESATKRVIYGGLPTVLSWRATEPLEGLHTEIRYEKEVPVYWPGPGGEDIIVIGDVVTVTVFQQADYGAVLEASSNLIDFAMCSMWGAYPYNQPVSMTWIRPTEQVQRDYPKIFFRGSKINQNRK